MCGSGWAPGLHESSMDTKHTPSRNHTSAHLFPPQQTRGRKGYSNSPLIHIVTLETAQPTKQPASQPSTNQSSPARPDRNNNMTHQNRNITTHQDTRDRETALLTRGKKTPGRTQHSATTVPSKTIRVHTRLSTDWLTDRIHALTPAA